MESLSAKEAAQIFLQKNIISAVFSKPLKQNKEISKIKIRKIILKDVEHYQIEEFKGNKTFHKNIMMDKIIPQLENLFINFKTVQSQTGTSNIQFLQNNKGKIRFNEYSLPDINFNSKNIIKNTETFHDNKKNYLLPVDPPPNFLKKLNFFTEDGKIINSKYNKFKQICRYLEFIETVLQDLKPNTASSKSLNIIDFGCGKAYLSFALYYYLTEIKKIPTVITGLDLKEDVINFCNKLSNDCKFSNLHFEIGDISGFEFKNKPDMVISLHACNTATDSAIAKAIKNDTKIIFAVPCCQHEINIQIRKNIKIIQKNKNPIFPMLDYGIITERFSSLLTDTIRAKLLEVNGYKVCIEEFIDMEHTPKNILIKAVKKNNKTKQKIEEAKQQIELIKNQFSIKPDLEKFLES